MDARDACPTRGTRATTATPRSPAGWAGTGATSACPPPTAATPGSCASSRSTTARGSTSTAAGWARTAAPTCPSSSGCPAPCSGAARANRLVIRVDSRRFPTDFPPSGLSTTGTPTGGWWNYGGLLREVYLRRIDAVDFNTVSVRPNLPCATCAATVSWRVTMRNHGESARRISVTRALRQPPGQPRHGRHRRRALRHLHALAAHPPAAAVVADRRRTCTARR